MPKLDKLALAKRRARVERMRAAGLTVPLIAQKCGVSISTIEGDLRALVKQYQEQIAASRDERLARHLADLDYTQAEAVRAWQRSKRDREKTRTKRTQPAGGGTGNAEAIVEREGQCGDTSYLATIVKCVAERCRILGDHAPTRTALTDTEGNDVAPMLVLVVDDPDTLPKRDEDEADE